MRPEWASCVLLWVLPCVQEEGCSPQLSVLTPWGQRWAAPSGKEGTAPHWPVAGRDRSLPSTSTPSNGRIPREACFSEMWTQFLHHTLAASSRETGPGPTVLPWIMSAHRGALARAGTLAITGCVENAASAQKAWVRVCQTYILGSVVRVSDVRNGSVSVVLGENSVTGTRKDAVGRGSSQPAPSGQVVAPRATP